MSVVDEERPWKHVSSYHAGELGTLELHIRPRSNREDNLGTEAVALLAHEELEDIDEDRITTAPEAKNRIKNVLLKAHEVSV